MPQTHYEKGVKLERKIVNQEKEDGCIAFRSAGSKSPIDVISIDPKWKKIRLIQCKAGKSYSDREKEKIKESYSFMNGTYEVEFEVIG